MTGKKFERTTPEAVGISSKSLERLIENLEQVTEMHGIVVMRHEKIMCRGLVGALCAGNPTQSPFFEQNLFCYCSRNCSNGRKSFFR